MLSPIKPPIRKEIKIPGIWRGRPEETTLLFPIVKSPIFHPLTKGEIPKREKSLLLKYYYDRDEKELYGDLLHIYKLDSIIEG